MKLSPMNKRIIEYLIIATAVILLIYGFYSLSGYGYQDKQSEITDSITM